MAKGRTPATKGLLLNGNLDLLRDGYLLLSLDERPAQMVLDDLHGGGLEGVHRGVEHAEHQILEDVIVFEWHYSYVVSGFFTGDAERVRLVGSVLAEEPCDLLRSFVSIVLIPEHEAGQPLLHQGAAELLGAFALHDEGCAVLCWMIGYHVVSFVGSSATSA